MNFKEVCKKIKNLEIQGAESIARAGIKALFLKGSSVKKLLSLRPTEPLLKNAIRHAQKQGKEKTLKHFDDARKKIIQLAVKKVKGIIFTHCHSTTVVLTLIEAKKRGIKFEVYNTETRPRFQGRKTSRELSNAKIKVTEFVDAAARIALKKSNVMLIGCDAILTDSKGNVTGVVNKVGSGMFAEIAYDHKVPVYVLGNSWKIAPKNLKIEERDIKEVWKIAPKKIKIRNPAFEIVDGKYVTAIISELGILKIKDFGKRVKGAYPWI